MQPIYVLDSGIKRDHPTFDKRVRWGFDAFSNSPAMTNKMDPHGHGTFVSGNINVFVLWLEYLLRTGIIGGKLHGLARKSILVDVRVFDEDGYGTSVDIIAGLDYVAGILFHEYAHITELIM
jgi:subtilisin family serine protease